MKIYTPIFTFFLVTLVSVVSSQPCKDGLLGSKTLYSPGQVKYSPPPKGYTPVFINHVGRHGSRHLTKEVETSLVNQLLAEASGLKELSPEGLKLTNMLQALQHIEKGNINSISLIGKQEQHDIAARMLKNYPEVFAHHPPCVEVAVTKKIRTQQSAEAFLSGLQYPTAQPCIPGQTTKDESLRFYDLSPAYLEYEKNGDWKKQVSFFKEVNHTDTVYHSLINKFFEPAFLSLLKPEDEEKFINELLGFAEIQSSVEKERTLAGYSASGLDFRSWFSCTEWQTLERSGTAEDFLKKGPGSNNKGIQVIIAAPLLADFIRTTDLFITTKNTPANLRFAHAETIAPFSALMGLEGASDTTTDILHYDSLWKSEKIIPLSANIQWILYKNKNNDWLIKFLLNEKETGIKGLSTANFPFYKWMDIRKLFTDKLLNLGLHLEDNQNDFLLKVK